MSRSERGKHPKDPRTREIERYYNNRPSGGWKAPGSGQLPFPASKDGQQQDRGVDLCGKEVPRPIRDAAQPRPEGLGDGSSGLVSDTYLTAPRLLIREGGGVIRLRVPAPVRFPHRVPRGEITGFSMQAARNLRIVLAALLNVAWVDGMLATLTYPVDDIDLSDWHVYKQHLDRFTKAFRRRYPEASAVWRLEFTKRGFPHYHLIIFGIPNTEADFQAYRIWQDHAWFKAVGTGLQKHLAAGCNVERVKSIEGARNYVAKYVNKQEQQCEGFTGRYWGKLNKDKLPFAPEVEKTLTDRQAVLLARVFRKLVESQVNYSRWKKELKECSDHGERGWSRLAVEFGGTLPGKAGDAVWLSTETWNGAVYDGERILKGTFTSAGAWHHYFAKGVTAGEILKGECGVVSDRMRPIFLKVPKKYRARRNHSATYLGDASSVLSGITRYLAMCDPLPDYRRPDRTERYSVWERRAEAHQAPGRADLQRAAALQRCPF